MNNAISAQAHTTTAKSKQLRPDEKKPKQPKAIYLSINSMVKKRVKMMFRYS
jgi:hypothetical protein